MLSSLSFDRIADRYDDTRGGEDRGRRFAGELDRFLVPGARILEVGVGTGIIARALMDLGHDVVGVDLSVRMLERARRRLGAPVVVAGDARRLPFADASFDQAVSVWVLHVVGDIAGVLREVARILRPGGRYLVIPGFTHSPGDPIGEAIRELQLRVDPEGVRRDDAEKLRQLAPNAGLRFVEAQPLRVNDYPESPQQAIEKLETRAYSILWPLSEGEWREAIEPTVAALRALPSPNEPIMRRSSDALVVLERPR